MPENSPSADDPAQNVRTVVKFLAQAKLAASYTPLAVKLWQISKTLVGPLSQERQFTFSGPFDSPPPTGNRR